MVFSIAIAHTQTEQTRSVTTAKATTGDRKSSASSSEGVMHYPLRLSGRSRPAPARGPKGGGEARSSCAPPNIRNCTKNRAVHHRHGNEFIAKRVQTRAS